MSRMNAGFLLAGRSPDMTAAMDRYAQAQQRNLLRPLQVKQIKQQIDLNALSMDSTRQAMDIRRQQNSRAQGRYKTEMDHQEMVRQSKRQIADFMAADSPEAWDRLAITYDEHELLGKFGTNEGYQLLRTANDNTDRLEMLIQQNTPLEPTAEMRNLEFRAQHGGLQPGTSDYQDFMMRGGQMNKASGAEQKIQRIMDTHGVDRKTATGIVDGVLNVSRHPLDGSIVITDLSNNQVTMPTIQGASSLQEPRQSAMPISPPSLSTDYSQSRDLPKQSNNVFDGTNVRSATGIAGAGASAANAIGDTVFGAQPFPNVDAAQTAMDNLATRTVQALSATWPGRPSNLTREMIDSMTVRPRDLATGPNRASNKVKAMTREIETAIASAHRVATSRGRYSTQQIANAQAALNDLLPLYQDYINLSEELDSTQSGAQPPQDDVDLMNKLLGSD